MIVYHRVEVAWCSNNNSDVVLRKLLMPVLKSSRYNLKMLLKRDLQADIRAHRLHASPARQNVFLSSSVSEAMTTSATDVLRGMKTPTSVALVGACPQHIFPRCV